MIVGVSLDQAVRHLREVLSRHIQPARRTAASQRKHDEARVVASFRGLNVKSRIVFLQALQPLIGLHADARVLENRLPDGKQRFLRAVGDVEASVERDVDWLCHEELLSWVLANGRRDLPLLQGQVTEFVLLCAERSA